MKKIPKHVVISLLLFILLTTICYGQKISPQEQKIVDFIDKSSPDAIHLIEKLVNIESPSEDPAGVKNTGTILMPEFRSIGMTAKWIDMPAEMKRGGHLLAETSGSQGKRVLMLGHLDTVLRGEKFRREGNKIYGTGTSDMKTGVVVMYYALKALESVGALKDRRIKLLLTGDEEDTGVPASISRRDMVDAAKTSDMVLSFENGGNNIATVARRGYSDWELEVSAKTGHSSAIFKESMGSGAIFEAARILNQFYINLNHEKYLTFNPSIIAGGTEITTADGSITSTGKGNVVPAKVIVRGDLRFLTEAQKTAAREKMKAIVAMNLPGTSAKIGFRDEMPGMEPTPANLELLKQLDQVSQDLGYGRITALDPGDRGAGDISYISDLIPGMDGLGATGGNDHAKGEYADLDTMPIQIKRAAILI
ncbi:MAG TPA: M20/M25/M40 family metallo-hydrolase, partial [Pyrinomonadaceae bacterium]|nr:M20/M25/M40 family metallo-hydrolase [Pyrinomonadaceae bacterium]